MLPRSLLVRFGRAHYERDVRAWDEPHELLERFLIGRGCSEPEHHARNLLLRFGSVPRVLDASWWGLWRAAGWRVARSIRTAEPVAHHKLRSNVVSRPILRDKRLLCDFIAGCEHLACGTPFLTIYVDADLRLIRVEPIRHEIDHCVVDISSQIARADVIGAHGFFLTRSTSEVLIPDKMDIQSLIARPEGEAIPLLAQIFVPDGVVLFVSSSSRGRGSEPLGSASCR